MNRGVEVRRSRGRNGALPSIGGAPRRFLAREASRECGGARRVLAWARGGANRR